MSFFNSCTYFKKKYEQARGLDSLRRSRDKSLEDSNILQGADDLGYGRTTLTPCRFSNVSRWYDQVNADLIVTAARLVSDINPADLETFESNINCYKDPPLPLKTRAKYRNVNGNGNNLQNPYWGSTGAPFGRFGPKTYADKINTPRKSVSGKELPSARTIVQHILKQAEKFPRTKKIPNDMANFFALFVTHDFGELKTQPLS
jgi:Animal haem peroxidase